MGYARSLFRDFESYLRIVVCLNEDDIQLTLKQYNEKIITFEISPGIYKIEDNSKVVYTMRDHKGTLQIEYDDGTMKTKLTLTRFGSTFGTLRFDEKSFFNTLLGFTPYWDYKPTNANHANNSGVYTSEKILKISTIDKNHFNCDVIVGSVVNGLRQTISYSFVLEKEPSFKEFCEPETTHFKKTNKLVLDTITFYLEDDKNEEINSNGETLSFTLQMFKI